MTIKKRKQDRLPQEHIIWVRAYSRKIALIVRSFPHETDPGDADFILRNGLTNHSDFLSTRARESLEDALATYEYNYEET